jgi:hypothetical protein
MATIRSNKLCLELHRPVSFDQARRFWLVTCTIASLGAVFFVVGLAARFPRTATSEIHGLGIVTILLILLCVPLGVVLLSAAPSLLLHPKTVSIPMQNRGVALSYYLCAPLSSWMVIGAVLALFWFIDGRYGTFGYPWPDWVYIARLLLPFMLGLSMYLWWSNLIRLSQRQTGVFGAAARVGVELLFLWVNIALLAWVILPFTFVHLRLILASL